MRCVFVLFDSLNRHMLGAHGGTRVPTPNFDRLAARAGVYGRHYVGSLPCMPARRDPLTGRLTFLHRSWGPLGPFDNAFPELLKAAGVHSQGRDRRRGDLCPESPAEASGVQSRANGYHMDII